MLLVSKVLCSVGLAAAASVALGCAGAADIPDIPRLDDLSAEYDTPTGQLSQDEARSVVEENPDLEPLVAGFSATTTVGSAVDEAAEPADARRNEGVRLQGSVRVTLRCPGALATPTYDPAINGSMSLTLAVADNRIRRTSSGTADACVLSTVLEGLDVAVRLDGEILLDIGDDLALGRRWSREYLLISVTGSISVGTYTFTRVTARITEGRVEHLFRREDGTSVVLSWSQVGVTVRDRNTTWSCSFSEGPCALASL